MTTPPPAPSRVDEVLDWLTRPPRPWLTAAIAVVTAAVGIAQLVDSSLYDRLCRDPAEIRLGAWWRLGTAMFVQDGRAAGLVFNLVILAVFGIIAERVLGRWRWLVLYFGCGLFGQAVSFWWLDSTGAGNSMCVAGLVGGLTTVALLAPDRFGPRRPARPVLYVVPALAVVGTLLHDNHGLPLLLGMGLGYLTLVRD
ncbi:rhomboid family intramembrane serine protease [Nocardia wallacei]|uniref:rhomboid family intramembrane serine protease n=1 Tax=Nocardia wallacei TaxID=480035 RepID=UPI002457B20B|nr:rhomboid family intramembrane serine protease [Nocardia wallacei]